MHYVYVIKSSLNEFLYIGQTHDLRERFARHNSKKEIATKAYAPYKLVYYEAYANKKDALVRELKLKQYRSSWGHLKKRLSNSL